jgi:hypothetical protein
MIVVLTRDDDRHVDAVEAHLPEFGSPVLRFDQSGYPADAALSVRLGAGGRASAVLRYRGADVDLAEADAVWLRRPEAPRAATPFAGTAAGARMEWQARVTLADVWELLDVPFVPATPLTQLRASLRVRQLSWAARLGFEIPDTLLTNDPGAFRDHHAAAPVGLVTRRPVPWPPSADGAEPGDDVVPPCDPGGAESVRLAPVLAQSRVETAFGVRVAVVGDEVFAAAVHAPGSGRASGGDGDPHSLIEAYPLSADVAARCVALLRALQLRYAGIELGVTRDERVVFLGLDPNAPYLWLEIAAGLPISRAVADLLVRTGRR